MRILLIAIVLLYGCSTDIKPLRESCDFTADSIRISERMQATFDSVDFTRVQKVDTVFLPGESLRPQLDSLKSELFLAKYKIEKVKFYLSIALKNPSQDKFLKGWIRRAVE